MAAVTLVKRHELELATEYVQLSLPSESSTYVSKLSAPLILIPSQNVDSGSGVSWSLSGQTFTFTNIGVSGTATLHAIILGRL